MTMIKKISAIIEKKGRKYWTITISGPINNYAGKLVINETSKHYVSGQRITVECADLSTRTKYGTTLVFEPLCDDNRETYTRKARFTEAQKWLSLALTDARHGFFRSDAQKKALELCQEFSALAADLEDLRKNIKAAEDHWEAMAVAQKARREAEERKVRETEQKACDERKFNRFVESVHAVEVKVGVPMRWYGKIIVVDSFGKTFRYDYERFGCCSPDMDGEPVHYCYYHEADDGEVAQLEAMEAAQRETQKRAARVEEIKEQIKTNGKCPDGDIVVSGEDLFDSMNAYGGGDVITVTEDAIWYIRNNGTDGDNWSRNNVRTGGAGAIGWKIPYDAALADELRELAHHEW